MTYNTEGIILRYRDIGEYDRIYSILTREHGKVDGWAQGVRKPQSKLVAHLQPLYFCDFMFARGRRFDRVAQVQVINRWASVWSDLERMGQAVYAASLVDMVLRPGVKERGVFELMESFLERVSTPPHTTHPLLTSPIKGEEPTKNSPPLVGGVRGGDATTLFSLKLLRESGFSPELRNCVLCKAAVEGLSRNFDAIRGGVLCADCFRKAGSESFPVSALTLETLETVLGAPLTPLEMPEIVRNELSTIARAMIAAHFGEEPRARLFMESMTKGLPQMVRV